MEVRGVERTITMFRLLGVNINPKRLITGGCVRVQRNIRSKQMVHQSGPPLPDRITARHGGEGLSGAIQYEVTTAGNEITGHIGVVASSTAAKYGRLHEEGGTITYSRVSAPWWIPRQVTATYPARPYLRPGLEDEFPAILRWWEQQLKAAVMKAVMR